MLVNLRAISAPSTVPRISVSIHQEMNQCFDLRHAAGVPKDQLLLGWQLMLGATPIWGKTELWFFHLRVRVGVAVILSTNHAMPVTCVYRESSLELVCTPTASWRFPMRKGNQIAMDIKCGGILLFYRSRQLFDLG